MQAQNTQIPSNATMVFSLKKCALHKIDNKKYNKVASGNCEIYSSPKSDTETTPNQNYDSYFIKVDNFVIPLTENMNFATINYPQTNSYLFEHNDGFIYAFSFNKKCQNLDKFQFQLNRITIVCEYKSDEMKPELKKKISDAGDETIQSKQIWRQKQKTKMVANYIGIFVGKITNSVMKPTSEAGKAISDRKQRISRQSISEQTKNKWSKVTQVTGNANQAVGNAMRPLINKCQNLVDSLGKNFNQSQNKFISIIRDYSYAFRDSLNEGQKKQLRKQQSMTEVAPKQEVDQGSINQLADMHEIGK